jgi:hypothetical protein
MIPMAKQRKSWSDNVIPDRYARKARLYPSLLVMTLAVVAIVVTAKIELSGLKTLWVGLGAVGGMYWLSQLARDPGKALESKLWEIWGGPPSVSVLRHCDTRIDPITKARYHTRLVELVPNTTAPTQDVERNDSKTADICYAAWSTHLRNSTRDQKRFHLLFDELVSYGYRRNLLGLRPYGLASTMLACLLCGVFIGSAIFYQHDVRDSLWLAFCANILLLVFWIFRVSPAWVRLTADNYAARLVESIDELFIDHSNTTAKAAEKAKKPRNVKKAT